LIKGIKMYFPVSGVEVNPIIPVITAFVISFFTSMGGVSGAFLLLPFQVSVLGFSTPSVSATNQLYNIVSIPGGIYRYIKEGRMVWPLAGVIVLGTLPGVFIGAFLRIQYLPDPRNFKFFAGLVLLYIGFKLLRELIKRDNSETKKKSAEQQFRSLVKNFNAKQETNQQIPRVKIQSISISKIVYEFYGQEFDIKIAGITGISFIVGIVGGVYGIGGGAIIAPLLVSLFGLPVYTIAGAALMGTFVTSIAGVSFYQVISTVYTGTAVSPDWMLGLLFGIGGFAGMYMGARLQKYFPAAVIKWILAGCILFTAGSYIISFF
jgi:uncharacterized membrane protein YfcA